MARLPATLRFARTFYRDHLTPSGRVGLWFIFATALLGINTFQNRVYMAFGAVAGLMFAASVASILARPKVQVRGAIARRTLAGETVVWHLEVTALATADDVHVEPGVLPPGVQLASPPAPGICLMEPGQKQNFPVPLKFRKRGVYDLTGVRVVSAHPFGLVKNGHFHRVPARVLVHPRFTALEHVEIPLGTRLHSGGLMLAHATGNSTEFIGTREYEPGDPVKKLHAASWARTGKPIVRVDQEEFFARIALVVDTGDPGDGQRLERAASAAAALTDFVVRSHYLIELVAAGPDLYFITAGRGLAHLEQVLDVLACLEATRGDNFDRIAPEFFDRIGKISTVLLVFLDWDDARARFVERVRASGAAVRPICIGTPSHRPAAEVTVIADHASLTEALQGLIP